MTHAMPRAAALLALPLTALLLTGCMATGTAGAADPSAGTDANSSASASASASASSPASTDATFGQTVTYPDGLAITVTEKGTFKPSQYADKKKAKEYRKFQVTVKNGTSDSFDPTLVYPTLQDGEAESYAVTDIENSIGTAPQTKLRPGKTVKWIVAFGTDTDDLTMDVPTGDFQHDDATFVSE